ncbi:hypothetical protein DFH08DRAFT_970940 [Mycena albidolilacea]|uniref:Uncharacterized protein n=1 Tax=Mycena albidolilacea TaxID=1033008 RepID=A0AAD6ZF57_9AGAR|nr:hypothetical protein DFH08DRAFT_970940 [Mycena albidolilacea]
MSPCLRALPILHKPASDITRIGPYAARLYASDSSPTSQLSCDNVRIVVHPRMLPCQFYTKARPQTRHASVHYPPAIPWISHIDVSTAVRRPATKSEKSRMEPYPPKTVAVVWECGVSETRAREQLLLDAKLCMQMSAETLGSKVNLTFLVDARFSQSASMFKVRMGRSNIWFTGLPSLSLVISICPTRYTWRLAGFMLQQTFPNPLPLLDVSWEWDDVFFLEWRDDALKALIVRLDGYKIDAVL